MYTHIYTHILKQGTQIISCIFPNRGLLLYTTKLPLLPLKKNQMQDFNLISRESVISNWLCNKKQQESHTLHYRGKDNGCHIEISDCKTIPSKGIHQFYSAETKYCTSSNSVKQRCSKFPTKPSTILSVLVKWVNTSFQQPVILSLKQFLQQ